MLIIISRYDCVEMLMKRGIVVVVVEVVVVVVVVR